MIPQPLFILAPPGSCSALVGAMLGQHPRLHATPGLNLFVSGNLAGVQRFAQQRFPTGLHGLLRTLAQLHEGSQTEDAIERARLWVRVRSHWPVDRVFDYLREQLPDNILIDRNPVAVLQPEFFPWLHETYPDAWYLHLTRHPHATGQALLRLLARDPSWEGILDGQPPDPERVWQRAHDRILEFTSQLPPGQSMHLQAEALLADPACYLPQITEWLETDCPPEALEAMLHPEHSPYAGPGPRNAEFGSAPDFMDHPALDADHPCRAECPSLEAPPQWNPARRLSGRTRKLAKQFGYR